MFNPTKTWRKWHRRVNVTQKRHAVAAAIAASGLPSLVMARGHHISEVPELPLVVSDGAQSVTKTKNAVELLKGLGCGEELEKVNDSKKLRAGKGKMRNRRYTMRKGPLVIFSQDDGISRAMRNIPGVDLCHVDRLNLLQLAPGGSFGRFVIWTESAVKRLGGLFGTYNGGSAEKKGYTLPRAMMTNADVARIINSNEVQEALRPALEAPSKTTQKKNPLKNKAVLGRLSPGALAKKKNRVASATEGTKEKAVVVKARRANCASAKAHHKNSTAFFKKMMQAFETAPAVADEE
jgi:large subunit ribosomal protein L4e